MINNHNYNKNNNYNNNNNKRNNDNNISKNLFYTCSHVFIAWGDINAKKIEKKIKNHNSINKSFKGFRIYFYSRINLLLFSNLLIWIKIPWQAKV